jgi:hypothetical protein
MSVSELSEIKESLWFQGEKMWYLIELHETFAQAIHLFTVDYGGVSVPRGGSAPSKSNSGLSWGRTSEHTVGRGDDIIEQLSSADRTSAALDMVHGSRVGLGGLIHFGERDGNVRREGREAISVKRSRMGEKGAGKSLREFVEKAGEKKKR